MKRALNIDISSKNITTEAGKLDFFIFSSALESAVSIEIKHFKNIFGFDHPMGPSSSGIMQMLGRIRDREMVYICGNKMPHPFKGNVEINYDIVGSDMDEYANLNAVTQNNFYYEKVLGNG